jgi:hypothetical protein
MAKIVTGGGVAAISGKSGGTVFARNKGGAYMRNFVKPTNPSTVYQEEARDRLTQYSNEWRTMTDAQREAWNAWAAEHPILDRLGAAKTLTGAQAYTKINTNRDLAGDATTNSTVPSDPAWAQNIINTDAALVATITGPEMTIPLGAGAAEGQILFVYVTPAISAGITNSQNQERLAAVVTLSADNIDDEVVSIVTDWTDRFGQLTGQAGRKVAAHVYQYLQGQTGAASAVSGIVAA